MIVIGIFEAARDVRHEVGMGGCVIDKILPICLNGIKLSVKKQRGQTTQNYQYKKISSCIYHLYQVPVEWERVGLLPNITEIRSNT